MGRFANNTTYHGNNRLDKAIGIYGGTFDPIHVGHIGAASDVQQALQLGEVRMVLSARPPHRQQPILSAAERFGLLQLALQDHALLKADNTEIKRQGPSYMVDTLIELRQQSPNSPLLLILGAEAFNGFMSWHRWQDILQLAHIVITNRAGYSDQLGDQLSAYIEPFISHDKSQLKQQTHGKIYQQVVTVQDVSATEIRQRLKARELVAQMLPDRVRESISHHGFYR